MYTKPFPPRVHNKLDEIINGELGIQRIDKSRGSSGDRFTSDEEGDERGDPDKRAARKSNGIARIDR